MKARGLLGRLTSGAAALALVCSAMSGLSVSAADTWDELDQEALTKAMGLGWDLGNTYEALKSTGVPYVDVDGEVVKYSSGETVYSMTPDPTAWGNVAMTDDLAKFLKAQGIDSVRMPVGWLDNIGDGPDYTIKQEWMDQVKAAVDCMIDNDLYVIVNMHSDGYHTIAGAWLFCDAPEEQQPEIRAKYAAAWTQIAETFKDYDEHLIFESMNEEFARKRDVPYKNFTNVDSDANWGWPDEESYQNLMKFNQVFVDSIRKTGGNNAKRWLLVPGWNTNIDYTCDEIHGFVPPTDEYCTSDGNRIAISVHFYDPYNFTLNEGSKVAQWGQYATAENVIRDGKFVNSGYAEPSIDAQIKKVSETFVSKGYPVIIGEMSATNKSAVDENNNEFRRYWTEYVMKTAKAYGCVPVYWDNGAQGKGGCAIFDRKKLEVTQPGILEGMVRAMDAEEDYEIPPVVFKEPEPDDYVITPDAHMILSDGDFYPQTGFDEDNTYVDDIKIYKGENKFVFNTFLSKEGEPASFDGLTVALIDLYDCYNKLPDLKLTLKSITADGKELTIHPENVLTGDLEDKNNWRLEIRNEWGDGSTKDKPVVDPADMKADSEIVITFVAESAHLAERPADSEPVKDPDSSVTESSESQAESTADTSSSEAASSAADSSSSKASSSASSAASGNTTGNPDTGAFVGLAAVAVSAAGIVVSRRRSKK